MRMLLKFSLISSVLFLFTFNTTAALDHIVIIPWGPDDLAIHKYRYESQTDASQLNGWQLLDKILGERNPSLKLMTSNLAEYDPTNPYTDFFKNTKYLIFCNLPTWIPDWTKKIHRFPIKKSILITWEPPSVMPEMFEKKTLAYYDKVLTWDDSLIDNVKFFKFCYPVLQPMIHPIVPFSQKKLLTQISGRKTSTHSHELYSERLKAIEFFENERCNDFDFYGPGWENLGYKNYKGAPKDKFATLKNYKFSICYENITNIKGYITEKIFDCFHAGVVPIYWGATNVADYIPKNCFIAREDFSSFQELVDYLRNMKEDEYNAYLKNIRSYLQGPQAKLFSHEAFASSILHLMDTANRLSSFPYLLTK